MCFSRLWNYLRKKCKKEEKPKGLTAEEINEIKAIFKQFERQKSGIIDVDDLGSVLKRLNKNPTENELEDMIREVDERGTGKVELSRFIHVMGEKAYDIHSPNEELRDAFNIFDRDGNGFISADELQAVVGSFGFSLKEKDIVDIIRRADLDGDGLIDFYEFVFLIEILSTLDQQYRRSSRGQYDYLK